MYAAVRAHMLYSVQSYTVRSCQPYFWIELTGTLEIFLKQCLIQHQRANKQMFPNWIEVQPLNNKVLSQMALTLLPYWDHQIKEYTQYMNQEWEHRYRNLSSFYVQGTLVKSDIVSKCIMQNLRLWIHMHNTQPKMVLFRCRWFTSQSFIYHNSTWTSSPCMFLDPWTQHQPNKDMTQGLIRYKILSSSSIQCW